MQMRNTPSSNTSLEPTGERLDLIHDETLAVKIGKLLAAAYRGVRRRRAARNPPLPAGPRLLPYGLTDAMGNDPPSPIEWIARE